jgi:hypothetical protein
VGAGVPRASELFGHQLSTGLRALVVLGAIVVIGLALATGALLAARRRAAERRQLEVPEFSAAEFQRFADHQTWIAQQVAPAPPHPSGPQPAVPQPAVPHSPSYQQLRVPPPGERPAR